MYLNLSLVKKKIAPFPSVVSERPFTTSTFSIGTKLSFKKERNKDMQQEWQA